MPQLAKGGKHVFGWSRVGRRGQLVVPPEALDEYGLGESPRVILLPGSRTSGGFALASPRSLVESPLGAAARAHPELGECRIGEGEVLEHKGKPYCWVGLRQGRASIPPRALAAYGVRAGDSLLVVRGSGLAISFIVRGPLVEEARRHPELDVFEDPATGPAGR